MQSYRQKRQEAEQTTATDEKLLAAQYEIELLREQVESWRGMVEGLNLELRHKEQQLQETKQELIYTNRKLLNAFMLEIVSLDEAKELAKTILKSEKSASKSLAELLNAIYDSAVKPEELEQIDKLSIRTSPLKSAERNRIVANVNELRAHSRQLQAQYKELGFRFVCFKAHFMEFKERCVEFKDESTGKNNVTANHSERNSLNSSPPDKRSKFKQSKKQPKGEGVVHEKSEDHGKTSQEHIEKLK